MSDLMLGYHNRSDHGRDGAPLDSFTCNCRALFAAHDAVVRGDRPFEQAHPDTMIGRK